MTTDLGTSAAGRKRGLLHRLDAWARPRVWVGDTVLALLVAVPVGASSLGLVLDSQAPGHWKVGLLVVVAVLHTSLAGRRTWPRATFLVIALAELVLVFTPDIPVPASPQPTAYAPVLLPSAVVFLFGLYAIAAHGKRPTPSLALGIGVIAACVVTARLAQTRDAAPGTVPAGPWQIGFVLAALLAAVLAAWSLGLFRRMRATYVDALEERTRRAEELREERARAAAQDERARIAREMHDMVAHSLAVIVRQADAGRYAARTDPAAAEQVLATIAAAGRESLADMRSLLGVLRRDDTPRDTAAGETGPQPTLDDVPYLLDRVRNTGLAVTLCEHGNPVPMDRTGELAAYRLIQEALTNVIKHAGPDATAEVSLGWDTGGLTVTVTDSGGRGDRASGASRAIGAGGDRASGAGRASGASGDRDSGASGDRDSGASGDRASGASGDRGSGADRGGNGLIGMRERLRLAGGDLVAQPQVGDTCAQPQVGDTCAQPQAGDPSAHPQVDDTGAQPQVGTGFLVRGWVPTRAPQPQGGDA